MFDSPVPHPYIDPADLGGAKRPANFVPVLFDDTFCGRIAPAVVPTFCKVGTMAGQAVGNANFAHVLFEDTWCGRIAQLARALP